jgi:hypothetical protein
LIIIEQTNTYLRTVHSHTHVQYLPLTERHCLRHSRRPWVKIPSCSLTEHSLLRKEGKEGMEVRGLRGRSGEGKRRGREKGEKRKEKREGEYERREERGW